MKKTPAKHRHSAWYGGHWMKRGNRKTIRWFSTSAPRSLQRGALIYSELRYIPGRPLASRMCNTLQNINKGLPVQKSFSSFSPCFETDNAHRVVATIQLRIRARYENTPRAHIVEIIKKIVCVSTKKLWQRRSEKTRVTLWEQFCYNPNNSWESLPRIFSFHQNLNIKKDGSFFRQRVAFCRSYSPHIH